MQILLVVLIGYIIYEILKQKKSDKHENLIDAKTWETMERRYGKPPEDPDALAAYYAKMDDVELEIRQAHRND
ncbi:MAG: hypothetical protein ACYC5G_01060 [Candidatus Doudnabacteria bacterium]